MVTFAPNLYFMYREHDPLNRFAAAKADGFSKAELCYLDDLDVAEVKRAAANAQIQILSFNYPPGEVVPGKARGLSALPGREAEFRALFAQGLDWSRDLGAPMAMCSLAGLKPDGVALEDCEATMIENLRWAAPQLAEAGVTMLVEPHCSKDFPGYVLDRLAQVRRIVEAVASPNVRMLLDTYHSQRMEGDLIGNFRRHRDVIAHVQVGNPPGRHEPDAGEVNHLSFFRALDDAGYDGLVVGEYFPEHATSAGLAWVDKWSVARA